MDADVDMDVDVHVDLRRGLFTIMTETETETETETASCYTIGEGEGEGEGKGHTRCFRGVGTAHPLDLPAGPEHDVWFYAVAADGVRLLPQRRITPPAPAGPKPMALSCAQTSPELHALVPWLTGEAFADPAVLTAAADQELLYPGTARAQGRDLPSRALSAVGSEHLRGFGCLVADALARGVPGNVTIASVQGGGAVAVSQAALRGSGRSTIAMIVNTGDPADRPPAPADWPSRAFWTRDAAAVSSLVGAQGGVPGKGTVWLHASSPDVLDAVGILPARPDSIAVLRVATPDPTCADARRLLEALHPQVSAAGGVVVVDHWDAPACRAAVEGFRRAFAVTAPLQLLGSRAAYWILSSSNTEVGPRPEPRRRMQNGIFDQPELELELAGVEPEDEERWLQAFAAAGFRYASTQLFPEPGQFERERGRIEGHIGDGRHKVRAVRRVAADPRIETICEIGFNAGHSTLLYLLANPHAKVQAFDLGEHDYVPRAAALLQERFPGRLSLVLGDSTETVPAFVRANPGFRCNLLSVDGGHLDDVPLLDLRHMRALANETFNRLLLDDSEMPAVAAARAVVEAEGLVGPVLETISDIRCACWYVPPPSSGVDFGLPCEKFRGPPLASELTVSSYYFTPQEEEEEL